MNDARTYVENNLRRELEDFQRRGLGGGAPELSVWEQVLIFKYSLDGYEGLNEALREGRTHPMERLLNEALGKLPGFAGLVFRGEELSQARKNFFLEAWRRNATFQEPAFLSASLREEVARMFSRGGIIFRITCRFGKSIERMSFYGAGNPTNEHEFLFKSKTQFRVVNMEQEVGRNYIDLIEILP